MISRRDTLVKGEYDADASDLEAEPLESGWHIPSRHVDRERWRSRRARARTLGSRRAKRAASRRKDFARVLVTQCSDAKSVPSLSSSEGSDFVEDLLEGMCGRGHRGKKAKNGVRPSLQVADIAIGSASDAGMSPDSCRKHRNRRRASILRLETLDPEGRPGPFLDHQSFFPVGSGYDQTLRTPRGHLTLEPNRVPKLYRSFPHVKRSIRPGSQLESAYRRRSRPSKKPSATDGANESLSDREQASLCDLYAPGSPAEDSGRATGNSPKPPALTPSRHQGPPKRLSRRAALLAEDDPLCASTEDYFSQFFARVSQHPGAVLRGALLAKEDSATQSLRKSQADAGSKHDTKEAEPESDDAWVRVVRRSVQASSRRQPNRPEANVPGQVEDSRKLDREGGSHGQPNEISSGSSNDSDVFAGFENHTKGFGSRMLEKMGFTGRLGARSQGIERPVEGHRMEGRSGLGVVPRNPERPAGDDRLGHRQRKNPEQGNARVVEDRLRRKRKVKSDKRTRRSCQEESRDVRKPKRPRTIHTVVSDESDHDSDVVEVDLHSNANPRQQQPLLLDDDEYETDTRSDGVEGSRRSAVVIELDVFLRGSFQRRLDAFAAAVRRHGELVPLSTEALAGLLTEDGRNLSDVESSRRIFAGCGVAPADQDVQHFLDLLDEAFAEMKAPEVNPQIVWGMRALSRHVHIGVVHYGTEARCQRELEQCGLTGTTYLGAISAVLPGCGSPYTTTWKEILCRLGVAPRRAILVSDDHGMTKAPSAVVAGSILGCRTVVVVDTTTLDSKLLEGPLDIQRTSVADHATLDRKFFRDVDLFKLSKQGYKRRQRRRVLALYEMEGLWYAGFEVFRCRAGTTGKTLVQFAHADIADWVDTASIKGLPRVDFHRLRAAAFPGLLDPSDVTDLV